MSHTLPRILLRLEYEEAANKNAGLLQEGKTYVKSEPRHRLRGHEDEVVAVAVQSELDVCVSVSARGLVLLHSLRKGWFLLRIRVPTAQELARTFVRGRSAMALSAVRVPTAPPPTRIRGRFACASRSAASSIAAGSGIGNEGARRGLHSTSTGSGRTSRGSDRCTGRGRLPRNTA